MNDELWDQGRYFRFVIAPPKVNASVDLWIAPGETLSNAIETLHYLQLLPPPRVTLSVKCVFRSRLVPLDTCVFDMDVGEDDSIYVVAAGQGVTPSEFDKVTTMFGEGAEKEARTLLRRVLVPQLMTDINWNNLANTLMEMRKALMLCEWARVEEMAKQIMPKFLWTMGVEFQFRVKLTHEQREIVARRANMALKQELMKIPGAEKLGPDVIREIVAQAPSLEEAMQKIREIVGK